MKRSQIAAQLYTLREYAKTAEDLDQTLAKVAKIGYKSVQVSGVGPIDSAQILASTERYGLSICATHYGYEKLTEDLDTVISEHKLWNCKYVGIGSMPAAYRKAGREGYEQFAREFSKIGERLQEEGLQFIYHNHRFEFECFEGLTGIEWLMQASDPEDFHFELDTYWAQAGGVDPAQWIYWLNGRMKVVHLKDMAIVDDQQVFAEIGQGNMNWDSIIRACREIGTEWYIVEQDVCRRDPFESLAMSYRYLAELADED
ncbi:MAG: sugar phosphate isomerase/epimerase [Paenibacillaceae bacterium]|nr:sugar phosphate isomerase/epimerase [Paenibacillaceae bacterium]